MQHTFTAPIASSGSGGAYGHGPLRCRGRIRREAPEVQATFDGVPYRGTLARMGGPDHILIVVKAIRERIGKGPGDEVAVTVALDAAPREVAVPDDLAAALAEVPEARAFFDGLAYTHRREYVRWVEEAKREETRARLITRTVEMLRAGKKGC